MKCFWFSIIYIVSNCAISAELPTKAEVMGLEKEQAQEMIKDELQDEIRVKALKEIATTYSIQVAFLETLKFHKSRIKKANNELNNIYNFQTLMDLAAGQINEEYKSLGLYVLPAVVYETDSNLKLNSSGMVLAVNNKEYLVKQHVKLVTSVPSWRSYLLEDDYKRPSPPPPSLIPKNHSERIVWEDAVKEGWAIGVKQAEIEIKSRVRRLVSDFKGMLNYIKLVDKGVLNPAYIAIQSNPINISKEKDKLKLNEVVYRVTAPTEFTYENGWKPKFGDSRKQIKNREAISDILKGKELLRGDAGS